MAKAPERDIVDPVPPRQLVPTQREREGGADVQEDFTYEKPVRKAERRSARETTVEYLKEIDPRRIAGNKRALFIIPIAGALTQLDDQIIGIVAPEMRADFGFSVGFLATTIALFQFVNILLAPVFGYVADRAHRLWMARIGAFIGNAGSIVVGVSTGVGGLIAGRLISGFGNSVQAPAAFPLIADYFPTRSRARAFAYFHATAQLFALTAPPIVGVIAEIYGWRSGTVTFGLIAVFSVGLLFLLKEPVRGYHERIEAGASDDVADTEQRPVSWGEAWRAVGSIVTVRRLWYATPFLQLGGQGFFFLFALLLAERFGFGPGLRATFSTTTTAVSMVAILFAAPVADRLLAFKPQRIMAYYGGSVIVSGLAAALMAVAPNAWLVLVLALPLAFIGQLFQPAQATLFSMIVPPRVRGLGMQTFVIWQLPAIIAFPFLGSIADDIGVQAAFFSFLPILLVGGLFTMSAVTGVERDIRAAKASAMADEEARRAKAAGRTRMLICRDVDVTYDGTQVLFGIDFDMDEGEIVALLGTNGAGKSTLLRAISGVHEASNGAIYLDGNDVTHVPPHENAHDGIVMVPGGRAIFPTLSVSENLRVAAWMYREDEEYVSRRTEEVLEMFPILRERYTERAGNMSGGEQQMLALSQAFLMRPRLLMIDELSLGLAPQIVEQLLEVVGRIHEQGTTILLVEQSLNVALTIAERAVFMDKGEIRFDGPTDDLLARPELVRSVFMGGAVRGRGLSSGRVTKKRAEGEQLLEVRDVSVSFGGVQALRDVSIDAAAAEIVGIIGPNGAGKTTLFDVISGFVPPDEGSVLLEAKDVTHLGPDGRARMRLGRSFQNATLFPAMTVRDNVAVALERRAAVRNPALAAVWAPQVRAAEQRIYRRVDALIEILGLEAYANKFVNELSTGSRRAVDIACIMASQPRMLLLDEPSSGLAQAETEELGPVIRRVVRETGCGVLVIEHDLPLVTSVSDRMVAMELGRVIATGTPEEVVNHPQVVASYLSASEGVLARSGGGKLAELLRTAGTDGNKRTT